MSTRGGGFVHQLQFWVLLEPFQFSCDSVRCSYGHRPDRCGTPVWPVEAWEHGYALWWYFMHTFVQGGCTFAGELLVAWSYFVLWSSALLFGLSLWDCGSLWWAFVSAMLSCCPCLRGARLLSFEWPCCFALAFDHLFEFLFLFVFFSFSFFILRIGYSGVLLMHSSRERLRKRSVRGPVEAVASSVMSDWQSCVDWLLAEYCRYRLRPDSCWCRWRTSTKGLCRGGLQVMERQVGLVRCTRWPIGSSASRAVQERHDEVVDMEPGLSWWPSQDEDWRGGHAMFVGFAVVWP
jgi:hypothetical protein